MSHDYFLTHRAHQIQRLCAAAEGNRIELPERHSRGGYPRELVSFWKVLDQINNLPIGDAQQPGFFAKFRLPSLRKSRPSKENQAGKEPGAMLRDAQRATLIDFERDLIRLRFSHEPDSVKTVKRIISAIIADHEFFYGLKPLPHADSFAYELLFPSWLNLYTAMNLRHDDAGEARLSQEQQSLLFRFLDDWRAEGQAAETEMVSAITFLIHRFSPAEALPLLQRLLDLCHDGEANRISKRLFWLSSALETVHDAQEVQRRLGDSLIVQSCIHSANLQKKYNLVEQRVRRRQIPRVIAERLKAPAGDAAAGDSFILTNHVRAILDEAGGFCATLSGLLSEHPEQLQQTTGLFVHAGLTGRALSMRSQELVARMAVQEPPLPDGGINIERLKPFAQNSATRMDLFSDSTRQFFQAEFVQKEKNLRALLDSCGRPEKQKQLASRLIQLAQQTKDKRKFFDLLAVATALDPQLDDDGLERTQISIAVLQSVQGDRSIGANELADLLADLRDNFPESLKSLERPLQAAANKSARLAKIYLALNEECELYRHTGRVSNFGVTRASFSHLERMVGDQEDGNKGDESDSEAT